MLKKLLKYDLENTYKNLIIFYALALFFGILTRIFFMIDNSFIMNIIAKICSGVTISMFFNILINNLLRLWVRFKQNLYGDESYLTHTLPISKATLYLAKVLTGIISLFTSCLVIVITLFIAYYSKENVELLKRVILPMLEIYDVSMMKILVAFLFIFFLEFLNLLQVGYTGIIFGHKMNYGKIGFSVLFAFIAYMIIQVFVLLILFLIALFNQDIMNLFMTNDLIKIDTIKLIIFLSIIIYTVTFVIGYFINLKFFQKGVNVD